MTRKGKKEFKFLDQPSGRCFECRWNEATKPGGLLCTIAQTHVTNPTCMQKIQIANLANIDWELERLRRGEDDDY